MTKKARIPKLALAYPERIEINQPRVARNELPWVEASIVRNPERVVSVRDMHPHP